MASDFFIRQDFYTIRLYLDPRCGLRVKGKKSEMFLGGKTSHLRCCIYKTNIVWIIVQYYEGKLSRDEKSEVIRSGFWGGAKQAILGEAWRTNIGSSCWGVEGGGNRISWNYFSYFWNHGGRREKDFLELFFIFFGQNLNNLY